MKFPDYYGVNNKPKGNIPTSRTSLEKEAIKTILYHWSWGDKESYMGDFIDWSPVAKKYVKSLSDEELRNIVEEY